MRLSALVLGLALSAPAFADRVEFFDATLQDFVEWSSSQLNRSIVVGSDIKAVPITVFASYSSPKGLESVLENAVTASGLYYKSTSGAILISAQPLPDSPDIVTDVLQLQHLQADFAAQSVRDLLAFKPEASKDVSASFVAPSPTSNALIVSATRSRIDALRKVLAEIDKPRRQVVITAVVAELSDSEFESIGFNLGLDSDRVDILGASLRQSDKSDLGFSLTFSGPRLSAFLQAVKNSGDSRILSTPQLLTLNRESASIVVGQNVPFITGQTTSGSTPASDPFQTIVRQDVGVTLEVTPFITPSGSIELKVMQSASSVSDDTNAADIITNTRRIATTVQLTDGDGVLLGGLRSTQTDRSVSGVPILSDIPLIGRAFRSDSNRQRQTNLVVLLTASIHGAADVIEIGDSVSPVVPDLTDTGARFGAAGARASVGQGKAKDVPVARL